MYVAEPPLDSLHEVNRVDATLSVYKALTAPHDQWCVGVCPAAAAAAAAGEQQPRPGGPQRGDHRHRGQRGGGPGRPGRPEEHHPPPAVTAQTGHGPHTGN